MEREEATRPLVGMQRLCFMAAYHDRLGAASPAKAVPLELVEAIAQMARPLLTRHTARQ